MNKEELQEESQRLTTYSGGLPRQEEVEKYLKQMVETMIHSARLDDREDYQQLIGFLCSQKEGLTFPQLEDGESGEYAYLPEKALEVINAFTNLLIEKRREESKRILEELQELDLFFRTFCRSGLWLGRKVKNEFNQKAKALIDKLSVNAELFDEEGLLDEDEPEAKAAVERAVSAVKDYKSFRRLEIEAGSDLSEAVAKQKEEHRRLKKQDIHVSLAINRLIDAWKRNNIREEAMKNPTFENIRLIADKTELEKMAAELMRLHIEREKEMEAVVAEIKKKYSDKLKQSVKRILSVVPKDIPEIDPKKLIEMDLVYHLFPNAPWDIARIIDSNFPDKEDLDRVAQYIFVFDDIVILDDRAIQKVLREVDSNELAKALKACSDDVRKKVFRNISKRAAVLLEEGMEFMGPIRLKDVEDAQDRIVSIIMQLEEQGEIVVARSGEDEIIV